MIEKIFKFFSRFVKDLAIDLGTANSLVYAQGEGIIINEPSVIALNKKTGKILAIGKEAKEMVGKTPTHIVARWPLSAGVISDFEITSSLLSYFISKANKGKLFKGFSKIVIGVPCEATEVERKSVIDAGKIAGAREVYLIEEALAAAIGARLPVQEAGGIFIVDIGGGTTEIAVISLGGIVRSKTLKIAGNQLTSDIIDYLEKQYKILIGPKTAEEVKIQIGSAIFPKGKKEFPIRGKNLITGLPEEISITDIDVYKAIEKSISGMVSAVKEVLEITPPELVSDIMKRGIFLCGGGALLKNFPQLLMRKTKILTRLIEDPLTAVVRGAGIVLENLKLYQEVLKKEEESFPKF